MDFPLLHSERGAGTRKDADFALVEIPEVFPSTTVVVDRDKILSHAYAQGDFGSWYFGTSPFGGAVGHPLILSNDLLFLFYESYDGNTARGLHAYEQLEFHSPVYAGETITISGAYVDKFERRDSGYVVLHAEARGADGRLLVTHRGTEIMRTRAGETTGRNRGRVTGRRVSFEVDPDQPVATRARLGLAPRTRVPGVSRHFTQDQLNAFSWAAHGYRNVHTDIGRARESGVPTTIVQALQTTGLITESMVSFFGASWFTTGRLDLRYVNPAFCMDELTVNCVVVGDDGDTLELEVWIDSSRGVRTGLGWAQARVDERSEFPRDLLGS